MSRTRSAAEVKADHLAAMGKDLGEIFTVLSNELITLCWQFQELSELWAGDAKQRLEVMNGTAPFFFWQLQRTWWDECILGIARLVGPKMSAGQPNLTFQMLSDLITDNGLKASVDAQVKAVVAKAAFTKTWRYKRIAHRDLERSLERAPAPLPPATQADVGAVLEDLAAVLNEIESHYLKSSTVYRSSPIAHGVVSLLYALRDGLRLEELRQRKAEKGEYRAEDWNDDKRAL